MDVHYIPNTSSYYVGNPLDIHINLIYMKPSFLTICVVNCLVFFSLLLFAASTSPPQVVCHPKETVVKSFRSMFGMESEVKSYIDEMVKKGYVVKSVAMMDDESWSKGIVVMEKY